MKNWDQPGTPRTCKLSEFGECQNAFTPAKEWGEFCCTEHRKRWHYLNRTPNAKYRGAEARHANGHDAGEVREKLAALGLASPKVEPNRPRLVAGRPSESEIEQRANAEGDARA